MATDPAATTTRPAGRRRPVVAGALVAVALACAAGGAALVVAPWEDRAEPTPLAAQAVPAAPVVVPGPAVTMIGAPAPAPDDATVVATSMRIPALGIARPVVLLELAPDRRLDPPADISVVGWYRGSAVPGRRGPAVMTGHVDSKRGPGVFHRLAEVPPGAPIEVDLSDGSTARFRVISVLRVDKDDFPTDAVYGPVPVSTLRVISCSGRFDGRHYADNVIVTAVKE